MIARSVGCKRPIGVAVDPRPAWRPHRRLADPWKGRPETVEHRLPQFAISVRLAPRVIRLAVELGDEFGIFEIQRGATSEHGGESLVDPLQPRQPLQHWKN